MSARWITIGSVRPGWYVLHRNCGFPNGFLMHWRGRIQFGQPMQFVKSDELLWAIRRRLQLARLEPMAIASAVQRDYVGDVVLLALVRRRLTRWPAPAPAQVEASLADV